MKLFAQHGYGEGQKIQAGLDSGYIDGVIYSPKDIGLGRLQSSLAELAKKKPEAERLFDPQYYATLVANAPNSRCGLLMSEYAEYFSARRRGQLEQEARVRDDLKDALRFTKKLDVSSVITPGIFVPRSLNSIEAVIAKNFVRFAKLTAKEVGEKRPVLVTLAISCDAIRRHQELIDFLTDLTLLDNPPDGFYLLVGTAGTDGRQEVFNADTIAGWLFLNHTLALNGFRVVNGYSDLMTPFLGACGATAGASGWWSNLRNFGLGRFAPEVSGGRLPTPRYLSCALLNRITFDELERLRGVIPQVLNGLKSDKLYSVDGGSEPERNQEVLQSWDAIRELNGRMVVEDDVAASLAACRRSINDAVALYPEVQRALFSPLDPKSDDGHLEPLSEGLQLFTELAELESP